METKLKMATIASVVATFVAVAALTIAPVGATHGMWGWGDNSDDFDATSKVATEVENRNYGEVNTMVDQHAKTGNVNVSHVDDQTGGAGTGGADNMSAASTSVSASNTGASMAPEVQPPSAPNPAAFEDFDNVTLKSQITTKVSNKNEVGVTTNVQQRAVSGDVDVHCADDIDGELTTGDASNSSTTTTTVSLSN